MVVGGGGAGCIVEAPGTLHAWVAGPVVTSVPYVSMVQQWYTSGYALWVVRGSTGLD